MRAKLLPFGGAAVGSSGSQSFDGRQEHGNEESAPLQDRFRSLERAQPPFEIGFGVEVAKVFFRGFQKFLGAHAHSPFSSADRIGVYRA
ncbi:hypothetical protein [Deinococcus yavapaiensis]|uniref:hypothetical protein n=1 Tax=Deinococcus yavapaiensis TaxID=309889 RepID=UPI0011B64242|nr:hypothetical protein [Deinococcus yavapaiensis]